MLTIQEIKQFIEEDKASKKKQQAIKGLKYYEQQNDIKDYRIFFYNSDGELAEDKNRLEIRPSSGFFGELIDQKTQFCLSNDEPIIDSDNPQLKELLKTYIDDEFRSELKDMIRYAGIEGFSYIYTYKNADDRLAFQFAEGLGVVEIPAKYASDKKDHVLYYYDDIIKGLGNEKDKEIIKIQSWDDEFIYYYVMVENEIVPDVEEEINPRPHVIYVDNKGKKYYDTFGFVPFFRFDNNRRQLSDLWPIKDYIDDYDLIKYGLSDNILSLSDGYICVKGFQGDNIDELVHNVRNKKAVGVSENGDLEVRTVDIPYQARKAAMEQDEKDIYRFGMGLNTSALAEGNYTNGVNVKSRYSLLDMKCDKVSDQLKILFKKICQLILDEINAVNNTAFTLADLYYNIDKRETITNALDNATVEKTEAETKQILVGIILDTAVKFPDEVVIKKLCEVMDIDYEEIKAEVMEKLESEKVDLDKASNDLMNTPTQEKTPTEDTETPEDTETGDIDV